MIFQGETLEEALENIREAAELWLEVAADAASLDAESERRIMRTPDITEDDL